MTLFYQKYERKWYLINCSFLVNKYIKKLKIKTVNMLMRNKKLNSKNTTRIIVIISV